MQGRNPATLQVAILGLGPVAAAHANAIRAVEGMELVACADVVPGKADAWAAEHGGGCRAFTSLGEMATTVQLDGLVIATPDADHANSAISAMRDYGLSPLLENSPTHAAAEAEEILLVSEGEQLPVLASMPWVHANPIARTPAVTEEVLGRRFTARAHWHRRSQDPFWNRGPADPWHNQSHHLIAVLGDIFGWPDPVRLKGKASGDVGHHHTTGAFSPALFGEVDHSTAVIDLAGDVYWIIESSVLGHHWEPEAVRAELWGGAAKLKILPDVTDAGEDPEQHMPQFLGDLFGHQTTATLHLPSLPRRDAFRRQALHWREVMRRRAIPRVGASQILWLMRIDEMYRSSVAARGRELEF